ncbi:MAG: hypothetical protein C0469_12895, partial [Cyanobacteria bacterium DS2.3.42]|nr:hypothetical protein [Cyanobacteria bacterium DS2.3.42]
MKNAKIASPYVGLISMSDFLSSPEGVVDCLYAAISFEPKQKPNYSLMYTLFHRNARITPPSSDTGGELKALAVEEFIEHFDTRIQDILSTGGREEQVSGKTDVFHKIAHVLSIYRFMLVGSSEPL